MKYVILEAMERLAEYEDFIGRAVARPTYLFVQKYGRSMEGVLKETAEAFGKKEFFLLRKEKVGRESYLLDKFLVEAEKKTELGKRFDGFVLVELTGEETEEERTTFYEYIKNHSPEVTCMFSVKDEETAEGLLKELEQQFSFVRRVSEECYSPAEQKEILLTALEQGGVTLKEEAEEKAEEILAKVGWQVTDHVENRLRNLANNLVYEQIMKGNAWELISVERLQEEVNHLTEQSEKLPIGFAPPTETKEQEKACPKKGGREMVA